MTTVDYARRRRRILLTGWLLGIGSIVGGLDLGDVAQPVTAPLDRHRSRCGDGRLHRAR